MTITDIVNSFTISISDEEGEVCLAYDTNLGKKGGKLVK